MSSSTESVDLIPDEVVRSLVLSVTLAGTTAVLAQVSIQLPGGIPFSFQPFGVFFAGLLLGPIWGAFAMVLYVLTGLAGAPVFSNFGAGIGYFMGPTGGFLVGFIVAAFVIGLVVHRSVEPRPLADRSPLVIVAGLFVSLLPLYAIGVPWFASVQGWDVLRAAVFMIPFLVGDLIKIAITVGIVSRSEWMSQLST